MVTLTIACDVTVILFMIVREEIISSKNIDSGMFPHYKV